jgi:hypothetical protein
MLILARFFQVDKSNAHIFVVYIFVWHFVVLLPCQIETETGSAGEQPVRDRFELLTKKSKKRIVIGTPF